MPQYSGSFSISNGMINFVLQGLLIIILKIQHSLLISDLEHQEISLKEATQTVDLAKFGVKHYLEHDK